MKTIKTIILAISLCVSYNTVTAQNLKSMPVTKRDSLLIAIAKEVILKYGPDYYREDFKPIIERHTVPPEGEMVGRIFYWVIFQYDETEEQLSYPFAARVQVWADTGKPSSVFFGNGLGRTVSENDLRNSDEIEPVLYEQRQVIAIYDVNDPDLNRKPTNLNELKRNGYVDQGNGQWVKTTPDVPPHKRKQ